MQTTIGKTLTIMGRNFKRGRNKNMVLFKRDGARARPSSRRRSAPRGSSRSSSPTSSPVLEQANGTATATTSFRASAPAACLSKSSTTARSPKIGPSCRRSPKIEDRGHEPEGDRETRRRRQERRRRRRRQRHPVRRRGASSSSIRQGGHRRRRGRGRPRAALGPGLERRRVPGAQRLPAHNLSQASATRTPGRRSPRRLRRHGQQPRPRRRQRPATDEEKSPGREELPGEKLHRSSKGDSTATAYRRLRATIGG